MAEAVWLLLATVAAVVGMAWLALSLDSHWRQVVDGGDAASRPSKSRSALRLTGALSLFAALLFCLRADHASMAVLVWIMLVAASAIAVAMTLSWQPRWLRLLTLPSAKHSA